MIKYSSNNLALYSRENLQQQWTIHQTSNLPPNEIRNQVIVAPSVCIDIQNISEDHPPKRGTKHTIIESSLTTASNSFPCSQRPLSKKGNNASETSAVDMLLIENMDKRDID